MIEAMDYAALTAFHSLPRVANLARASDDSIQVLADAREVAIPAPMWIDQLEPLPDLTRDIVSRGSAATDPVYLARLNDVLLHGHRDLYTLSGLFLTDLAGQAGLHNRPPNLVSDGKNGWLRHLEAMTPELVDETAALLFFHSASGDNHSHWLLQTLPQLRLFQQAGVRPAKLVVQPSIRPYQRETLRLLGWNDRDILVRSPDSPIIFRELYVGYVDGGLVPDDTIFAALRKACPPRKGSPEKLYVSRLDARDVRRFLNEDRLIERVQQLGYTVVTPSVLGASEEIALFGGARVIAGPLGAGLYNALFAEAGATVVALSDPNYVMTWLQQVAALRGHRYGWMFGIAFDSTEPVYGGTHNNWLCDIEQVAARLGGL